MLYRGPSVWFRYYSRHSCFGSLAAPPHFSPFSHGNYCIWTALGPFLLAPGHLPTLRWSQCCVLRPSRDAGWHWTLYAMKLQMCIKQRYHQSEDFAQLRAGRPLGVQGHCFSVWGNWDPEKWSAQSQRSYYHSQGQNSGLDSFPKYLFWVFRTKKHVRTAG